MASTKKIGFAVSVIVLFMCVSVYSAWTEPIHLSELNSPDFVASRPRVSSDENIIYFVRNKNSSDKFYLWEAQKNAETGLYDQERVVSEIGRLGGQYIFGVWISEDRNRLYHCWADPHIYNGGWGRALSMATRSNSNELWNQTRHHNELQTDNSLSSVCLTSNELNIMWTSGPSGGVMTDIYTASRSSIEDSFSDICHATELEEIGAIRPYISADGLSIYFTITGDDGFENIWKGVRYLLDEPFEEFRPLRKVINMPETKSMRPCITPDGGALYFYRGAPDMDASEKGVYVSYWVETPMDTAVKNIRKAITMKKLAIKRVNASIAPETKAIRTIEEMLKDPDFGKSKKFDLIRAKARLEKSIQKQINERKELLAKIESLKLSIQLLLRENTGQDPGSNRKRPRHPIMFSKPAPSAVPGARAKMR